MISRMVMVFERKTKMADTYPHQEFTVLREVGQAQLLTFGVDYEELKDGVGQVTTAIVGWPDGRIQNIPLSLVRLMVEQVGAK